jgi:hypothetical protein
MITLPVTFADHSWRRFAACRKVSDPELFFPESGRSHSALRVCAACPVRDPCLDFAIAYDIRHGVWGGTSFQDRQHGRRAPLPIKQVQRPLPAKHRDQCNRGHDLTNPRNVRARPDRGIRCMVCERESRRLRELDPAYRAHRRKRQTAARARLREAQKQAVQNQEQVA